MRCAPPSVPNIQSQHWYLNLSRDTHENTRASTHSSVPRKMSNPPPDQQIAPRGTRNQHLGQHLGQLCAGETGTSLLPTRGQATADSGRNRSTAGGYDVFAAGQARASYRVAKNLFSEIKNQDQKPINAKIYFFSLIGHVGTRAIFSKSTAVLSTATSSLL